MQFKYKARTKEGEVNQGVMEAASLDLAVSALQRRNFLVMAIEPIDVTMTRQLGIFESFFARVPLREVVILTRQLATLFEARVPMVDSFKILIDEMAGNKVLKSHLADILDEIRGGASLSQALDRHPAVFSRFYVAMIMSGEESGKLEDIFRFMADYLERSYDITRKARTAFIYPAIVLTVFIAVMVLVMVFVIPGLASILEDSGQELPIYTRIVIGISLFLRDFGIVLLVLLAVLVLILGRYIQMESGKLYFSRLIISAPLLGNIYRKIYLSRIADSLYTLLSGGVTVVRALEISAKVVGNEIYSKILIDATEAVKGGSMISESFAKYEDLPPLLSQMVRIGEETGKLDYILKSVADFYRKDVDSMVDGLITTIEPVLIAVLAIGVGILVAAVLLPIYNLAASF